MKLLSLFTGYGGLDMAVRALTDSTLVGVSDIDKAPNALLQHYHPDIPNIGNVKSVNWANLPFDFDVLTGGYPCQPFSTAGHRRGVDDDRHLWPDVLECIAVNRPAHVFLENVRGHLSLGFSEVLQDLAHAGYAVEWSILAASSVGAAHRRERLYIYAQPDTASYSVDIPDKVPTAGRVSVSTGFVAKPRVDDSVLNIGTLLPTPLARDHKGASSRKRHGGLGLADVSHLFPSPAASDTTGARKTRPNGYVQLKDMPLLLSDYGSSLLPTPNTMDNLPARTGAALERQLHRGNTGTRRSTAGNLREDILLTVESRRYDAPGVDSEPPTAAANAWSPFNDSAWGKYADAIARWSLVTGQQPPVPVQLNRNGNPQLTAEFPAWLMGLPDGYLNNPQIGLTRSEIIKLAGNGVVPHAAFVAYSLIFDRTNK